MSVTKIGYTRLKSEVTTLKESGCQEVYVVDAENATRDHFLEFANNHSMDIVLVNFNSISDDLNIVRLTKVLEEIETTITILEKGISETVSNKAFIEIIMFLGKKEKEVLRNRTIEGIKRSRDEGRVGGRPTLSAEVVNKITYLLESKKMTYREVADICGVSIGSVCKYNKLENMATVCK